MLFSYLSPFTVLASVALPLSCLLRGNGVAVWKNQFVFAIIFCIMDDNITGSIISKHQFTWLCLNSVVYLLLMFLLWKNEFLRSFELQVSSMANQAL